MARVTTDIDISCWNHESVLSSFTRYAQVIRDDVRHICGCLFDHSLWCCSGNSLPRRCLGRHCCDMLGWASLWCWVSDTGCDRCGISWPWSLGTRHSTASWPTSTTNSTDSAAIIRKCTCQLVGDVNAMLKVNGLEWRRHCCTSAHASEIVLERDECASHWLSGSDRFIENTFHIFLIDGTVCRQTDFTSNVRWCRNSSIRRLASSTSWCWYRCTGHWLGTILDHARNDFASLCSLVYYIAFDDSLWSQISSVWWRELWHTVGTVSLWHSRHSGWRSSWLCWVHVRIFWPLRWTSSTILSWQNFRQTCYTITKSCIKFCYVPQIANCSAQINKFQIALLLMLDVVVIKILLAEYHSGSSYQNCSRGLIFMWKQCSAVWILTIKQSTDRIHIQSNVCSRPFMLEQGNKEIDQYIM